MRSLTMMLLMTLCLSSCRSLERKIICAQLKKHEVKQLPSCDISLKYNRCRCRCFDFNTWEKLDLNQCAFFSPLTGKDPVDLPIEACEGISGFFLTDMATEIRPNIKALSTLKGNLCQ